MIEGGEELDGSVDQQVSKKGFTEEVRSIMSPVTVCSTPTEHVNNGGGGQEEEVVEKERKRFGVCSDSLLHNLNDAIVCKEIGDDYPTDRLVKSLEEAVAKAQKQVNDLETFRQKTKDYFDLISEHREYRSFPALQDQLDVIEWDIRYNKWFIISSNDMIKEKITLETYRDVLYQHKIDAMLREWDRVFHRYSVNTYSDEQLQRYPTKPLRVPYDGKSYRDHAHDVWADVLSLGYSVAHWGIGESEKHRGPEFTGCECFDVKVASVEKK